MSVFLRWLKSFVWGSGAEQTAGDTFVWGS
jgi:hypothetical protein